MNSKLVSHACAALAMTAGVVACATAENPLDNGEDVEGTPDAGWGSGGRYSPGAGGSYDSPTAGGSTSSGSGGRSGTGGRATGAGNSGNAATGGDTSSDAGPSEDPDGPTPVPPHAAPGDCGLDNPAFCETFETLHEGGRGGPMDETRWSYARFSHVVTQIFTRNTSSSGSGNRNTPTFCGEVFSGIDAPDDVDICSGRDGMGLASNQLNEVFNDREGFSVNSMRIRQPFDFTGRTGTIVFDVDAKINQGFDGHGWWTEIWITEDPAPIPYHGAPTIASYPRNGIGFQIVPASSTCFGEATRNQIGRIVISEDYRITRDVPGGGECFHTEDGTLNRFKVLVSTDRVEFYANDVDNVNNMRRVASFDVNLNFSLGYVHLQHAHYNANKAGDASPSQTYRWDNIGFDGPTYPTPRAYDVPDELADVVQSGNVVGKSIGYYLTSPKRFELDGVDLTNARRATFNFNFSTAGGRKFRYRFNGNEWHVFTAPSQFGGEYQLRAFTAEVPLSDLVTGKNVLEVEDVDSQNHPAIGNMDLTIDVSE